MPPKQTIDLRAPAHALAATRLIVSVLVLDIRCRPPRRGRRGGYHSSMLQNRARPAHARHRGGESRRAPVPRSRRAPETRRAALLDRALRQSPARAATARRLSDTGRVRVVVARLRVIVERVQHRRVGRLGMSSGGAGRTRRRCGMCAAAARRCRTVSASARRALTIAVRPRARAPWCCPPAPARSSSARRSRSCPGSRVVPSRAPTCASACGSRSVVLRSSRESSRRGQRLRRHVLRRIRASAAARAWPEPLQAPRLGAPGEQPLVRAVGATRAAAQRPARRQSRAADFVECRDAWSRSKGRWRGCGRRGGVLRRVDVVTALAGRDRRDSRRQIPEAFRVDDRRNSSRKSGGARDADVADAGLGGDVLAASCPESHGRRRRYDPGRTETLNVAEPAGDRCGGPPFARGAKPRHGRRHELRGLSAFRCATDLRHFRSDASAFALRRVGGGGLGAARAAPQRRSQAGSAARRRAAFAARVAGRRPRPAVRFASIALAGAGAATPQRPTAVDLQRTASASVSTWHSSRRSARRRRLAAAADARRRAADRMPPARLVRAVLSVGPLSRSSRRRSA